MAMLILVVSFCLVVAFFYGVVPAGLNNLFWSYYAVQLRFIAGHIIVFILGLIIFVVLTLRLKRRRKDSFLKILTVSVKRVTALFVAGSFLGLLLLIVIAFLELNLLSIATYINPNLIGVATSTPEIREKLISQANISDFAISESEGKETLSLIASVQSGRGGIYASRIIPSIPSFFVIPPKKTGSGILMVSDTVIVTDVDSPGFRETSPVLANLMIRKYITQEKIKSYPRVSLMDKNEYLVFRREDFNQKLNKFDEVIKKLDDAIILLEKTVEEEKIIVSDKEEELETANLRKEKEYSKCVNAGYYKSGTYVRTNTKSFCEDQVKYIDGEIEKIKDEWQELKNNLENDERRLNEYKAYRKYYSGNKLLTEEVSSYITFEFGTFNPPDNIKLVFLSENEDIGLADYFEILIHEYLHYASYDETGKKLTSSFFEEGLTEYFARKIIKYNLGVDTNIGYPVNVKIIETLAKRIPESDLSGIYFTNDQPGLEKLIDKVYGKDFYKNNIISLETLQYLSDKNEILKHANEIMAKIGGEPLKDKDIYTSGKKFN